MNEISEPFVSIVTPFYNSDKYLSECIESVLAQKYTNWEYILVNNRSTDRSAEIAREYSEKDTRIRLVHNDEFLSQVQNYNHALRQIDKKSKYCKIVQADDLIFPECISRMVAVAEESPSIGIVGCYRLWGTMVRNVGLRYPDTIYKGKDVCRSQLIYSGHYFGTPTSILLRSDIVRNKNPFYREDIYFEDTIACFEVLKEWDFGFVHQVECWERKDNESISTKLVDYDPRWLLSVFIVFKEYGEYYLEKGEYNRRYRQVEEDYLRYLARCKISRRTKDFWDYHKKGLNAVGYELDAGKLFKFIILEIAKIALNPVKDVKRIITGRYY